MTEPAAAKHALPVLELLLSVRTPQDVRISPDGNLAAFCMAGPADVGPSQIHVIDLSSADSAPRVVTVGTEVSHVLPRWSPDGRTLLAALGEGSEPSVLAAIDVGTGRLLWDVAVTGCIEDIAVAGQHVVARVADPGSERDGMHLGLRVSDTADPCVTKPGSRLRRLVTHYRRRGARSGQSTWVAVRSGTTTSTLRADFWSSPRSMRDRPASMRPA